MPYSAEEFFLAQAQLKILLLKVSSLVRHPKFVSYYSDFTGAEGLVANNVDVHAFEKKAAGLKVILDDPDSDEAERKQAAAEWKALIEEANKKIIEYKTVQVQKSKTLPKESQRVRFLEIPSIDGVLSISEMLNTAMKEHQNTKDTALDVAHAFMHRWENKITRDYRNLEDKSAEHKAERFSIELQEHLLTEDWDPHAKPKDAVKSLLRRCRDVKQEVDERLNSNATQNTLRLLSKQNSRLTLKKSEATKAFENEKKTLKEIQEKTQKLREILLYRLENRTEESNRLTALLSELTTKKNNLLQEPRKPGHSRSNSLKMLNLNIADATKKIQADAKSIKSLKNLLEAIDRMSVGAEFFLDDNKAIQDELSKAIEGQATDKITSESYSSTLEKTRSLRIKNRESAIKNMAQHMGSFSTALIKINDPNYKEISELHKDVINFCIAREKSEKIKSEAKTTIATFNETEKKNMDTLDQWNNLQKILSELESVMEKLNEAFKKREGSKKITVSLEDGVKKIPDEKLTDEFRTRMNIAVATLAKSIKSIIGIELADKDKKTNIDIKFFNEGKQVKQPTSSHQTVIEILHSKAAAEDWKKIEAEWKEKQLADKSRPSSSRTIKKATLISVPEEGRVKMPTPVYKPIILPPRPTQAPKQSWQPPSITGSSLKGTTHKRSNSASVASTPSPHPRGHRKSSSTELSSPRSDTSTSSPKKRR